MILGINDLEINIVDKFFKYQKDQYKAIACISWKYLERELIVIRDQ